MFSPVSGDDLHDKNTIFLIEQRAVNILLEKIHHLKIRSEDLRAQPVLFYFEVRRSKPLNEGNYSVFKILA